MNIQPPGQQQDLAELLSEVYDADTNANNPRTMEFLEAGRRLLHRDLARDAGQPADTKGRPPFEELLAWLSRRRVVTEALQAWEPDNRKARDSGPTEAAYRYRWRTQAGYLRDLVIWALSPRMQSPPQIAEADKIIDAVQRNECQLSTAIDVITAKEVQELKEDKAFRLQMVFQATLAHDLRVQDALDRIDKANVEAWTDFAERNFRKLGLELRSGMNFRLLGCALHAAGEGALFREVLSRGPNETTPTATQLLDLIAKALVIASVEMGKGTTLDEELNNFVEAVLANQGQAERRPDSE